MTEEAFEKKLQRVDEQCTKLVQTLADDVRKTVVVPICRRRKLSFMSGMGTFFFYRGDERFDDYEAEQKGWSDLVAAYRILSSEVPIHNHMLGQYVEDVK